MGGDGEEIFDKRKQHRPSKTGRKAEKKKRKGPKEDLSNVDARIRNPKAFAINNVVRAERKFRRKQDIDTKKERAPAVDRTPVEPPPFVIAIVGPPKVGKSTLFQNLIKNYTKQTLSDVKGPVTIISGKKRRLTLIECNNDIHSMIDVAKVADLVLLLVDASFGFEMEIFEFLNICQVHGFPQIMGVLTHLDLIKSKKVLKKTKKTLKHRFWTEVYPGSKLFYLSGYFPLSDTYPKKEIQNLARFVSVMKFRPTTWRAQHAYIVADRMEDLTSTELTRLNEKTDRTICLYGYVHGTFLKPHVPVHIPGLGDYTPFAVAQLPDPCPLPMKERALKRSLNEKEKMIYAPFSGVGGIVYDKDAVYIDLGGSHSHRKQAVTNEDNFQQTVPYLEELRGLKSTLDQKMESAGLRLFTHSEMLTAEDVNAFKEKRTPKSDDEIDDDSDEMEVSINNKNDEEEDHEVQGKPITNSVPSLNPANVEVIKSDDGRLRRKVLMAPKIDDDISASIALELQQLKNSSVPEEDEADSDDEEDDHSSSEGEEDSIDQEEFESALEDVDSDDEFFSPSNSGLSSSKSGNESSDNINPDSVRQMASALKARLNKSHSHVVVPGGNDGSMKNVQNSRGAADSESSDESGGSNIDESNSEVENENGDTDEDEDDDDEQEEDSLFNEDGLDDATSEQDGAETAIEKRMRLNADKQKAGRYAQVADEFMSRYQNRSLQRMVYEDVDDYLNVSSKTSFDLANCMIRDHGKDLDANVLKTMFIGGDYAATAKQLLDDDDEDVFGDFEELDDECDKGGSKKKQNPEDLSMDTEESEEHGKKKREALKKKLKEKFDMEYDDGGENDTFYKEWKSQVEEQSKINKTFFEDVEDSKLLQDLQGFCPGTYVRIELSHVPCEFVQNFDPQVSCPIVVGSLDTSNEETLAVVQARVKKHRWHPKILKTRDPVILSVGWRRFQTIMLYSVQDHNMRNRMIKYTPEHLHCVGNFYGPMTPQGTGILGIAPVGFTGFRITLTGTILDMDKSTELVKKLKLVGHPVKVFKKSAFIEGMFTSQLEVAKFVGAKIKTVSGIRGVVKRQLKAPPGAFRATFEDKIVLSDIVFCRTWARVDVPKFYLNLPTHIVAEPRLLKTIGQLKREQSVHVVPNEDNLYTKITREEKSLRPLKIPRSLQQRLPYKDKPKLAAKEIAPQRIAVIKEPHERKMDQYLKVLKQRMNDKASREKLDKAKKAAEREKLLKKADMKQNQRQKELRKKVFRALGKMQSKPNAGTSGHNKMKRKFNNDKKH